MHNIGTLFAATYANMVNDESAQENLYRLYGPKAEISHVTPEGTMTATTVGAIQEQLNKRLSLASSIEYTSINVQEGYSKSVIVLATGVQTPVDKQSPRTFSQVFVLVPQPDGFYCNNDIFVAQEPVVEQFASPDFPAAEEVVANSDATEVAVDAEEEPATNGEEAAVPEDEAETVVEPEEPVKVEPASEASPAPEATPVAAPVTAAAPVVETPPVVPSHRRHPPPQKVPMSYASLAAQPKLIRPQHRSKARVVPAAAAAAPAPVTEAAAEESGVEAAAESGAEAPAGNKSQATRPQDRPKFATNQSQNQVFIRPTKVGTHDAVNKLFQKFGPVEKVQLKEQGFGFVTFKDQESVAKAIAAGDITCEDQRVVIESMKPQRTSSAGRGRGRNVRGGRGAPMRAPGDRGEGRVRAKSKPSSE